MWNQVELSLHESMVRVMNRVATLLPGIVAFILAFLFFLLVGWLIAVIVRRILEAVRFDERMSTGSNAMAEWAPRLTPTQLISRGIFWCFITVGIMVGVSTFAAGTSESVVSGWVLSYELVEIGTPSATLHRMFSSYKHAWRRAGTGRDVQLCFIGAASASGSSAASGSQADGCSVADSEP